MTTRVKIGDVVQIPTPKGLAFAQFTHKEPLHGALIRVFPGTYREPPNDIRGLLEQQPTFSTFFPLQASVKSGLVSVVGNYPVPEHLKQFPLFRAPMRDLRTNKVSAWWLWDGKNEWPIGELSPERRALPIREVVNDTLLVERITTGWTPATDRD